MRANQASRSMMLYVIGLVLAVALTGRLRADANLERQVDVSSGQDEVSFSLTRLPENPKQYSLVVSGTDERVISGSFSLDQLQILKAIMVEAEKFALGTESVGQKEPITTRFMDKQEEAFIVDVEKAGNQSLLFLTLQTELGRLTVDAGRIIRTTRREEGFFFDLLSRLESILPKVPAQPSK